MGFETPSPPWPVQSDEVSPDQRPAVTSPTPSSPQVSKAAADLMAYCDAHIHDDPLITPVPTSENPFREKKFFCTLL